MIVVLFIVFAYIFVVAMPPIWDTDFWWHLRTGEWISQHHTVPTTDIFSSIHPEREWKTFNWLFEILLYGLHQSVGLMGIRVFFAMIVVAGFVLWFRYFFRETKNSTAAVTLLILLLTLFADRLRIRPHLINFPFEALIALFLQSGGTLNTWRRRIGFFVLGVLWSNFHTPCAALGASVICLGSLLHILIAPLQKQSRNKAFRTFIWPAGLSVLAIMCNPYGPSLLLSGLHNISPVYDAFGNGEWNPPLIYALTQKHLFNLMCALAPLFAVFLGVIVLIHRYYKTGSLEKGTWLDRMAAPIGFLAISQTALRFVYLSTPFYAWILGVLDLGSKKIRILLIFTAVFLSINLYHYQISRQGGAIAVLRNLSTDVRPDQDPEMAADLIRDAQLNGKIFTPTFWGGYILWFAHPSKGVSSDGRNNVSNDVLQLQKTIGANMGRNGTAIIQALDSLGVDIAVLPRGSFPFQHWPTDQWIRVAQDEIAEVFLRVGSEDMIRVKKFLKIDGSSGPTTVQNAATTFFGNRYLAAHADEMSFLKNDPSENAVHRLAKIERIGGHDEAALQTLIGHLETVPNCLQAATEIAEILHDHGRFEEARKLLAPVKNIPDLPDPTKEIWTHLQTHK